MKKMPCLFVREFEDRGSFTITKNVAPGCEWVLAGEGIATRKWDGTACMVSGGRLYRRYDAKKDRKTGQYKAPPTGALPCSDPDPTTGHWPHWVPVGDEPESRWHREAWERGGGAFSDGTYELVGPAVNGNAERLDGHALIRHGGAALQEAPRDFDGLRSLLTEAQMEGIVFHHPDGRMCKIRRNDFGLPWGSKGGRA